MIILEFFLQVLVFLALAGALLVAARGVPRVRDEDIEQESKISVWIKSLPLERMDAYLWGGLNKILRKMRLFILKVDNILGDYLDKTREYNGNGKQKKGVNDLIGIRKKEVGKL